MNEIIKKDVENTKAHLFLRGRGKGIQERRLRMNLRCKRIRRAWYHGKQKKKNLSKEKVVISFKYHREI